MTRRWLYLVPAAILGLLLFTFLGGALVQQLWNWLLPALFGWPRITFWQALGLLALCRILFGGLRLHGSDRAGYRRRMAQRWEGMTPDERERFRQGMRGRWGAGPSTSEGSGQ